MAGRAAPAARPAATLRFRPVTRRTMEDFAAVFDGPGGPKYCWCMLWRVTRAERAADDTSVGRRRQMLGRIADGVPVGLVGYADGEPVAWVSIAPKASFVNLGGPDPAPGENVWSLTCMYIRRALRGSGHGHAMIAAAVAYAGRRGATSIEAYPVNPDSPSYRHMGFVPAFAAAGFTRHEPIGTRRHLMRLTLGSDSRAHP